MWIYLQHLFNSRYILEPVFNRAGLFGTTAVGWDEWVWILAFGVVLFVLVELEKAVFRRKR